MEDNLAGGTTILALPKIADCIKTHGIIACGYTQFVISELTPIIQIEIINVYKYNHTRAQARL